MGTNCFEECVAVCLTDPQVISDHLDDKHRSSDKTAIDIIEFTDLDPLRN